MAEKISPDSTMFFNKERPKYQNSAIDEINAQKATKEMSYWEKFFAERKEINNANRKITE